MTPSQFAKKYMPVKVYTESGWKYVNIHRYVSGEPRKKKWVKETMWDFECFVKKQHRYKESKGNFTGSHHQYSSFFVADGMLPPWVAISWKEMSLCFYGKGSPATFAATLRVVDYYLNHADLPLSYLGWKSRMSLEDYGYWYFGLDCNGFAGAFYAEEFPSTQIDGGDHINYLDDKKTLTKREGISDLKTGDMLVREGKSGEGNRHVALIENISKTAPDQAFTLVVQSAGSRNGLSMESMLLKKLSGSTGDAHGKFHWKLVGYHDFHYIVGPKQVL
jgi:hypothetical protein